MRWTLPRDAVPRFVALTLVAPKAIPGVRSPLTRTAPLIGPSTDREASGADDLRWILTFVTPAYCLGCCLFLDTESDLDDPDRKELTE